MSETACTDAGTLVRDLWQAFASGRTGSQGRRRAQLDGIARFLVDREPELLAAMREDLGKPHFEAYAGQSCIAPDNILAHEAIEPALVEHLPRRHSPLLRR